jgi:glycosyltransferase involved in cell wall biosynthesis
MFVIFIIEMGPILSVKTTLLFTPKYPPSRGGAATFYSNLIETEQSDIDFFVITKIHDRRSFISSNGTTPVYSVLPRTEGLHRYIRVPIETIILALVSFYLIFFNKIDIIHTHASSFSVIGLAAVATIFRTPIINDCRDEKFRPWIIKRGPTPLWFSCASNIDEILKKEGIPKEKIMRLPVVNPEYVKDYRQTERTDKIKEMIYIGTIEESKGIFLLLDAFEIISNSREKIELTIVGNGPDRSKLQKKCRMKGLENAITFTGALDHGETLGRLANADVLVLPSESEGVPRVVLEGQEVGTPVVATAVGGIPDVISHKKSGMLTEQTAESVAKNVRRLVRDDELYQTVVENGVKSADDRSWKYVGERLLEGYDNAALDFYE